MIVLRRLDLQLHKYDNVIGVHVGHMNFAIIFLKLFVCLFVCWATVYANIQRNVVASCT
jgi:hypothetical protein